MDGRKRHKRGRMMRGEGDPWSWFWFGSVWEDFFLEEGCGERGGISNLVLESVC